MWPEVYEQINLERANIDALFTGYQDVIQKIATQPPDFIELSALATMLHSFYNGIENILKRIAAEIDHDVPAGPASHAELLVMMTHPSSQRPPVISRSMQERLSAYLSFRHVYRHAYAFQLDWKKMRELVLQSDPTWQWFQKELEEFFE